MRIVKYYLLWFFIITIGWSIYQTTLYTTSGDTPDLILFNLAMTFLNTFLIPAVTLITIGIVDTEYQLIYTLPLAIVFLQVIYWKRLKKN